MNHASNIKPEDLAIVFNRLHDKFSSNFNAQLKIFPKEMENVELQARGILTIGNILSSKYALSLTQKEVCAIFDEVFADQIISVYLAACALDIPGQMILRRSLELGVATVYLWEQPTVYWGWKECNIDLTFNEMLTYLDSQSFRSFVVAQNPKFNEEHLFDFSEARNLYRKLSNTVHGKIAMFETQLNDRFSVNGLDWETHLDQVVQCQKLLYKLWFNNFNNLDCDLRTEIPQISRLI